MGSSGVHCWCLSWCGLSTDPPVPFLSWWISDPGSCAEAPVEGRVCSADDARAHGRACSARLSRSAPLPASTCGFCGRKSTWFSVCKRAQARALVLKFLPGDRQLPPFLMDLKRTRDGLKEVEIFVCFPDTLGKVVTPIWQWLKSVKMQAHPAPWKQEGKPGDSFLSARL